MNTTQEEQEPIISEAEEQKKTLQIQRMLFYPAIFVLFLWLIEAYFHWSGTRLIHLGIYPRSINGLTGILTSPFIHADISHLGSNSVPLLLIGTGLFYFYKQIAYAVLRMIWVFTGAWVWLAARPDYHIGASGLVYGLVSFLFFSGLIRKDTRLMAISLLVTFLYGSLVWGILPVDQTISWESHLFGGIAGLLSAIYYRKEGPQRPKAQWELDEELEAQQKLNEENAVENAGHEHPGDLISEKTPELKIHYHFKEKNQSDETGRAS